MKATPAAAAQPGSAPFRRGAAVGLAMVALSCGLFYTALDFPDPQLVSGEATLDTSRQLRLENFWQNNATPLLQQTQARDAEALRHAQQAIDDLFKKYGEGAPKFADSLTGWGTRFKILYRSGVEAVERKDEKTWTQQLIQEKFAAAIVTQDQLEKDLVGIGRQFAFELEASRNQLLAGLEMELAAANLTAELPSLQSAAFRAEFDNKLAGLLAGMPGRSVRIGVGSLAAGIAAEEAVRQIIRVVVAQLATRLAATAATAGGAAGAAAATGAGGGTVVAPGVGTAIGLVGGFIVGALVDWKMTDEFEDKIEAQVHEFLTQMKTHLSTAEDGLLPTLARQSVESERLHREALRQVIVQP